MFKGRPFLGIISGFFFGLFLGPTLWLWGVIPLHSDLMWILPLIGVLLGLIMAAWAPFGAGPEPAPPAPPPATTEPSGTTLEQDAIEPPTPDDAGA
jgi:hypothetical protein